MDYLDEIKNYLEENGIEVIVDKGIQKYAGQVLGCEQSSAIKSSALCDGILYVGDGRFHPIGINLKTGKDVFIFNPFFLEFRKLDKKEIEQIKMKRKAQLVKFYSSQEIGVMVSTKPGQNRITKVRQLQRKFPEKNFYLMLFDNIDFSQLDNFNFIDSWINSACPRIEEDIKVLNIDDVE